tara:strand:+ start:2959 stop:3753 length:795 start_codon:yes stop_codon:yes gene_type:complete
MDLSFTLLNKKEVTVKEILYRDLRKLALYSDSSISNIIKFLESFIITKGLTVVEKLLAFFILREKCIGEQVAVGSTKGNVNIDLQLFKNNIGSFDDIQEEVVVDNIVCTLNYPTKFYTGDTDFIFSLIEKLKIEDEEIVVSLLSEKEYKDVFSRLPDSIFGHLEAFVDKNRSHFDILVFEGKENMKIDPIRINMFDISLTTFIVRLFDCVQDTDYREMIFTLSKRIPDVSYLTSCTFLELNDYYKLYLDEIEKQNQDLKNQKIS